MRALGPVLAAWLCLAGACGFDTSGLAISPLTDGRVAASDGATLPDGRPDAPPPDAMPDAMLDAMPCGMEGLACCTTGDACTADTECGGDDTCTACGALFQSCCDPGGVCRGLTFCSFGTCLGL